MKVSHSFFLALTALFLCAGGLRASSGEFGSLAVLTGIEAVREQLKVTPAQADRLDQIRTDYRDAARSIVASTSAVPAGKAKSQLDNATSASNRKVLAVLTSGQKKELYQIEKRYLGAHLVYSPKIQKKLGITPDQAAKIQALQEAHMAHQNAVNASWEDGKITQARRLATLRSARLEDARTLLRILTPAQRDALQKLE